MRGQGRREGLRNPILAINPSVAPSGADFFTDEGPWNGNFFFATLRGERLYRLALGGTNYSEIVSQDQILVGEYGRLRDVVMGPGGALYFSTSNRDGRGSPARNDDRILRIRW